MANKRKFTSAAYRKRKRQRALRLLGLYSFLIILFITTFLILVRIEPLSINSVKVSGNSIEDEEIIMKVVLEELEGSYFYLIPKKNLIFYPRKKVENTVLEKFPRVYYADVSYDGDGQIHLEVKERKPFWIWCQEEKIDCYFVDEAGVIFAEAPNFSGDIFFKIFGNLPIEPLGQNFSVTGWRVEDLKNFISKLSEIDLRAINFSFLEEKGNAEVGLQRGGDLLISQNKSLEDTYRDLNDALAGNIIDLEKPFEYIDLRFDNKVFYKIKEE